MVKVKLINEGTQAQNCVYCFKTHHTLKECRTRKRHQALNLKAMEAVLKESLINYIKEQDKYLGLVLPMSITADKDTSKHRSRNVQYHDIVTGKLLHEIMCLIKKPCTWNYFETSHGKGVWSNIVSLDRISLNILGPFYQEQYYMKCHYFYFAVFNLTPNYYNRKIIYRYYFTVSFSSRQHLNITI